MRHCEITNVTMMSIRSVATGDTVMIVVILRQTARARIWSNCSADSRLGLTSLHSVRNHGFSQAQTPHDVVKHFRRLRHVLKLYFMSFHVIMSYDTGRPERLPINRIRMHGMFYRPTAF